MKDRIKKIMEESGLSASKFADKIGVPRSGLSHILSGRNKPSLDYVVKLLNAFPNLDPNWLIKGQEMPKGTIENMIQDASADTMNSTKDINNSLASVNKKMEGQADKLVEQMVKENVDNEAAPSEPNKSIKTNKKLERIVLFYSDGSFKEYLSV